MISINMNKKCDNYTVLNFCQNECAAVRPSLHHSVHYDTFVKYKRLLVKYKQVA